MTRVFFPMIIAMPTYTEAISTFGESLVNSLSKSPGHEITRVSGLAVGRFYQKLVPT